MSSPEKAKGNRFERQFVNIAKEHGLSAERAYGSNGRALGENEEVDVKLEHLKVQCKVRKKIGDLYKPSENVDIQAFKEDRGETYVMMRYELLLEILKHVRKNDT